MGKRLPKQALLSEIRCERLALDDALAFRSPAQMAKPGVTRGGWSVKDVLAHVVEWQRMCLGWYAAGLRGESPEIPAPGFTLRDLPRLNAMIHRKHHRRSLSAVLSDYRLYHERVVALVEELSNADLVTLNRLSWTGPSWTLSDYLRASTAAHDLWARTRIRRWWRAHGKPARRAVAIGAGVLVSLALASACTTSSQAGGSAPSAKALAAAQAITWPALPVDGFVSGRAATTGDVLAGRAAFSMQIEGRAASQPLPIAVPQYAFHVASGKRTPGIVIQAEAGQGKRMLGFQTLSKGIIFAAPESEFELLGTSIPPAAGNPAR